MFYDALPSAPAGPGTAVKVIETDDHTDFICKIYQLNTKGIAAEVASYFRTTVSKKQGNIDVSVNTKTGIEYISVTAPVFQFPCIESAINILDQQGTKFYEDGKKIESYKLKNRLASDVAAFVETALLSSIKESTEKERTGMEKFVDRVIMK